MQKINLVPALIAAVALVSACSTVPTSTSLLDQTRAEYQAAQNSPTVAHYASSELRQAGAALDQANAAANHDDSVAKVDQLAYLAQQKIALTQSVAKQKAAEADIANAGKERDQLRLDQRTHEADRAKVSAEQARLDAQVAQGEAAEAQRKAELAQGKTNDAERMTQEAQAHAAQLEAQLADLAAKKTDRGMVITLGDVLFGTDQARLNPDGMRTAQKLADVLQQNPQRTVLIEGFTDSTGSAAHNQELSERRATAVRDTLSGMGVSRERIAIRGYGESFPVAANNTAESRQMNRRVEIVLSDANGKVAQR
jgi:outer membrane protein OmpA-like peptidoglycan-associated protein